MRSARLPTAFRSCGLQKGNVWATARRWRRRRRTSEHHRSCLSDRAPDGTLGEGGNGEAKWRPACQRHCSAYSRACDHSLCFRCSESLLRRCSTVFVLKLLTPKVSNLCELMLYEILATPKCFWKDDGRFFFKPTMEILRCANLLILHELIL